MERFFCGAEVVCGEGALSALARWRGKRLLLVAGPGLHGAAQQVLAGAAARETTVFSPGEGARSGKAAMEGAGRLGQFDPDVVAALGDGEIMACAKTMVLLGKKPVPLVTIPTLPASGEEASGWAAMTHQRRRLVRREERLQPGQVILDPACFQRCSRDRLAEEGVSLLADAVESFTARESGVMTTLLAREAFCSGWAVLPAACMGSAPARQRLQIASVMTGMAYDRSGLGLCHVMAGVLASRYGKSGGKIRAVLLPEVIGWNSNFAGGKHAELARAAGLGGSTEQAGAKNLKNGLLRIRRELGLPDTLAQVGIRPEVLREDMPRLTEEILAEPVLEGNPAAVDDFMIRRILEGTAGRL